MKINYFFICILLLISIFSCEVGSIFLSLWAYSSIAALSIIALVFVIARIHMQYTADIKAHLDALNEHIRQSSYELFTQIDIKNNELKDTLKKESNFLESSVREQSKNMTEYIQAGNDAILKSIEGTYELFTQLDIRSNELKDTLKKESNFLESSVREQSKNMTEHIQAGNDTILKSIEGTYEHIDHVVNYIKDQCASLSTDIKTVQSRAQDIEKSIAILSDDDYYARIASSIHVVTSELKADLNEKFRQIIQSQKDTNNEISILEILLQAIQKSIENKTLIQTEDQNDSLSIDTIVDNDTNNTVTNYLKNGKIIKSIMTNPKGIVVYELEFDGDNISRSTSYNDKGDMTIEQTFYENGQVHYRNEYTSKGKTTTEFDLNGKKI